MEHDLQDYLFDLNGYCVLKNAVDASHIADLNAVLDKAVGELPEPLAEVLGLVDIQGYPVGDAARALGLNEGAARAALARARNHVRGRLTEYLGGGDPTGQGAPR